MVCLPCWDGKIDNRIVEAAFFAYFCCRERGSRRLAQVVELVDTLVSGTSGSDIVQVRVLSWARNNLRVRLVLNKGNLAFLFSYSHVVRQ